jgi:hypothetical protein
MRIALFCLEASRDDFGHLRIRFAFCVYVRMASAIQMTGV